MMEINEFLIQFLAATSLKDLITIVQGGKSVFKVKSGLRSVLQKSDNGMEIKFVYKNSKKNIGGEDGNFEKINALMLLQIPLMDLDRALNQVYNPNYQKFVSVVSSLNLKLGEDINELLTKADDTSFAQAKINSNYYKALSISTQLKSVIQEFNGKLIQKTLKKVLVDLAIVVKNLENRVGSSKQSKEFQHLTANFIANICLFKPCLEKVNVTISSMLVDIGLMGFCQDHQKGPYDIWQVEGVFTETVRAGKLFTFNKGDTIYLCLSVNGVYKARLKGELNLFGSLIKGEFTLNEKQIVLPKLKMKLHGKYTFFVKNKISFQLENWNMLNVDSVGETFPSFNSVGEIQKSLDNYTLETYDKLKARLEKSKSAILAINSERAKFENEVKKVQAVIRKSETLVARAKKNYAIAQTKFKKAEIQYNRYRSQMISIDKAMNSVCRLKTCPYGCIQVPRCQICQDPYKINRTVPSCKVSLEDRSYGKLKTVNGMCSHVVEERGFKYTGNCKGLLREKTYYTNVINRINKKVDAKQPLTLEDAYLLETINIKEGRKIREQVMAAEFFKSLNYKLKNGLLMAEDFANAVKYTKNKTFANKLRKDTQNIKNGNILKAITAKINASEPLTKLDYERLRVCDSNIFLM